MNRRTNTAVFLCALLISAASFAQDLPTAKPDTVGLSSERLERIATAVQRGIDDKRIAGAVTLVSRRGRVAWFKAQGMMDREAGKPMRPDTMFRICSMTKPVTSVAVMMLYEEGRWNAVLGSMYKSANVAHGILPYDGTLEESVKHLASLPLLLNPGERWEYSLGVDVLGRLVEVVSGKPLDEFLRIRIFEPPGMKDTYFYPPENKLDRLAVALPPLRRISFVFAR